MNWNKHCYRVGSHADAWEDLPTEPDEMDIFITAARKSIEPWLSAVFQAEHLNLIIGSGFTISVGHIAGAAVTGMAKIKFDTEFDDAINAYADRGAQAMGRGSANIEDQFRAALAVLEGLYVINATDAGKLKIAKDKQLKVFLDSLLKTESGIARGENSDCKTKAESVLQSFLLSFASRATSRERLHVFTSNYDRLIEHGCDLAGLRIIDRLLVH